MKILHIDCSIRDERSLSKELSALFVTKLTEKFPTAQLDYLDVSKETPSHPSALFIRGNYTPETERSSEMVIELAESELLVDRMILADLYVIGMPMYNFSVPSNFKAFIDNVVRINRTFKLTEAGGEGLLVNKRVYIINTRGVDFTHGDIQHMDQLQPYLTAIFGFIGLTDLTFINVSPVQFAAVEAREGAIERAKTEILNLIKAL
ncbi:FMN-dependent NADH-azoreductase [Dyadobacter diqingensis]|uniref:FMN-dependent NADH-azoreductase n=1 Tax=Dyadobacter diqingensis TaxID=2938121 RepID=UPI0020C522AE|nr:NAD(P)H-dependent oxidoreductase [Dyadobacter diqingensis]